MKSYSETKVFPEPVEYVFRRAQAMIEALPDPAYAPWRCHEVARAVHKALMAPDYLSLRRQLAGLEVIDGKYGTPLERMLAKPVGVEHSWIMIYTPYGTHGAFVLDTYAVGRLPQVQLVDTGLALASMYQSGESRTDIEDDVVQQLVGFLKGV